jgi:hypothetical protein
MFCKEVESRYHLFFECVVARYVWANFASFFGLQVNDLSDVSRQWLNSHKYAAALTWCISLSCGYYETVGMM